MSDQATTATPAAAPSRWRRMNDKGAPGFLGLFGGFGEHMILLGESFVWLFRRPFRLKNYLEQMEFVGVGSLPIILMVGLSTGMVTALQAVIALSRFQQERFAGFAVGVALAQEMAPVFTALMITARAGAGMATELGSMRIHEQIDALTTFAVNPVQYLVTPRIIATTIMVPVMTMVFNLIGLVGAFYVIIVDNNVDYGQVMALFREGTDPLDYIKGLLKAVVFGVAVSLTACYQGFHVRGGAKEVGRATAKAVVVGSVSVLLLDYFLIEVINAIWPYKS